VDKSEEQSPTGRKLKTKPDRREIPPQDWPETALGQTRDYQRCLYFSENRIKLRIVLSLENPSRMYLMSGTLSSLSRRLTKLEQQLADRARRAKLASCNCSYVTIADPARPEEFEAEMNLPCPAHGFRRLGRINRQFFYNPDHSVKRDPRLDHTWDQMMATYKARLDQANREVAHDPQES